jgi:hypothetical protein
MTGCFPMNRVLILFIIIVFIIGISYDLKYGTLEATAYKIDNKSSTEPAEKKDTQDKQIDITFVDIKVKSGQTVLSIVEKVHEGNTPVSITQIVKDFEMLNSKTEAQTIQIGKTYSFPVYH